MMTQPGWMIYTVYEGNQPLASDPNEMNMRFLTRFNKSAIQGTPQMAVD